VNYVGTPSPTTLLSINTLLFMTTLPSLATLLLQIATISTIPLQHIT